MWVQQQKVVQLGISLKIEKIFEQLGFCGVFSTFVTSHVAIFFSAKM
jgi:hypothetical protein